MNTQAFWVLLLAAALGNSNADSLFDWDYCSSDNLCSSGQGDCDLDAECDGTLVCGNNNCQDFDSTVASGKDCCRDAFDWNHCSTDNLCGEGQGDCDSDAECDGTLVCGNNNCHYFASDVASGKDCCRDPAAGDWNWCSADYGYGLCGDGEGDCDSDDQCEGSLVCGTDNCADMNQDADWAYSNKDCCKEAVTNTNSGCTGNCAGNSGGAYGGYA